eukprot:SAG31_NODE_12653_length_927_cov_0.679952_1_plen_75_part_00
MPALLMAACAMRAITMRVGTYLGQVIHHTCTAVPHGAYAVRVGGTKAYMYGLKYGRDTDVRSVCPTAAAVTADP